MSMTLEQLEAAALELSPEERARLAERLIASLDADEDIESAWVRVVEERYEELRTGREKGLPLEEFRANSPSRPHAVWTLRQGLVDHESSLSGDHHHRAG